MVKEQTIFGITVNADIFPQNINVQEQMALLFVSPNGTRSISVSGSGYEVQQQPTFYPSMGTYTGLTPREPVYCSGHSIYGDASVVPSSRTGIYNYTIVIHSDNSAGDWFYTGTITAN